MWIIVIRKRILKFLLFIIILSFIGFFSINRYNSNVHTNSIKGPYVAIIIDDFGNNGDGTDAIINLDIPITAAVMPFLPYTQRDGEAAHNANLEVIVHVPMEPDHGKKEWLGPRGITCDLSTDEVKNRIKAGLEEIPWAKGMNNHMGSKATKDLRIMKAVLEVAKERNMFYVDSKTTAKSVVSNVASSLNVPCLTRDVFLDGGRNKSQIEGQLLKLGDIALKRGYAIGIGHVGFEGGKITAEAIQTMIPVLKKKGITFVYISQINELLTETAKN